MAGTLISALTDVGALIALAFALCAVIAVFFACVQVFIGTPKR